MPKYFRRVYRLAAAGRLLPGDTSMAVATWRGDAGVRQRNVVPISGKRKRSR
jgi:hypothetical protein